MFLQVHFPQSYSLMYPPPYLSQPQSVIHPFHHHNNISLIKPHLLIAYNSPQSSTQLMTKFPQMDSCLTVPVFNQGDNPIACINKEMAFLIVVASSRVTVQQVQGRQGQSYVSTGYKDNATSSRGNNARGQARVVKCYYCQGEGHMDRQCTQPKRTRNAAW
ncbi:retrovirus-related pol polyprotein from transposon TNT 1-94 [Tanacetum coccineum]